MGVTAAHTTPGADRSLVTVRVDEGEHLTLPLGVVDEILDAGEGEHTADRDANLAALSADDTLRDDDGVGVGVHAVRPCVLVGGIPNR